MTMAAFDLFRSAVDALSQREREVIDDIVCSTRQALFAARSEDERLRLVEEFVREAHDFAREASRS
jgi:hypothetical protein